MFLLFWNILYSANPNRFMHEKIPEPKPSHSHLPLRWCASLHPQTTCSHRIQRWSTSWGKVKAQEATGDIVVIKKLYMQGSYHVAIIISNMTWFTCLFRLNHDHEKVLWLRSEQYPNRRRIWAVWFCHTGNGPWPWWKNTLFKLGPNPCFESIPFKEQPRKGLRIQPFRDPQGLVLWRKFLHKFESRHLRNTRW